LINLHRYDDAITNLDAYIRHESRRYEGYYNLGRAYVEQGNYKQAITPLSHAAGLAPRNYHVRYEYGLALARTGRINEAMRELRAAEKINPGDPQAHYQLALLLNKTKQSGESHGELAAFQQLKHQKDQQESAGDLNNKANKLYEEGKFREAATVYRQVLKMSPDNAKWHYNFSLALAKLGARKEQQQELETVIRLDPNMADAHNDLGWRKPSTNSSLPSASIHRMPKHKTTWGCFTVSKARTVRPHRCSSRPPEMIPTTPGRSSIWGSPLPGMGISTLPSRSLKRPFNWSQRIPEH
jgi:tetratricopeptide (TPR) repeat protein